MVGPLGAYGPEEHGYYQPMDYRYASMSFLSSDYLSVYLLLYYCICLSVPYSQMQGHKQQVQGGLVHAPVLQKDKCSIQQVDLSVGSIFHIFPNQKQLIKEHIPPRVGESISVIMKERYGSQLQLFIC